MDKRVLPIKIPTIINSYQEHANAISIISANAKKDIMPWVYSSYVQLYCLKNFHTTPTKHLRLDFFINDSNPYHCLEREILDENFLTKNIYEYYGENIIKKVKEWINQGKYVRLDLNEYYIHDRRSYRTRNRFHDVLIYGYSESEQLFYISGYNNTRKYSTSIVTYLDFKMAFISAKEFARWEPKIYLFKYITTSEYYFNLNEFTEMLGDYLYKKNTHTRFDNYYDFEFVYGVAIYESLIDYIKLLRQGITPYDIRPFHVIYEHKNLFRNRYNFLVEMNVVPSGYESRYTDLVEKSLIIRNLILKYIINNGKNNLDKVISLLNTLRELEEILLYDLYTKLK